MIDPNTIMAKEAQLRGLLKATFGIDAPRLDRALRRAGRRLPKHLHAEGAVIVDAVAKCGNPKLARMLDARAIDRAHARLTEHLGKIDPKELRKDAILGRLGVIVFNLIVVFAILVGVLIWRGFV